MSNHGREYSSTGEFLLKLVESSIVKHPRIRSLSREYDPNLYFGWNFSGNMDLSDLCFDREVKVSRVPQL